MSQIFFWSCRSSRMFVKLINDFVWILQNSWSALRSQTFSLSYRSCIISVKIVNIFVWLLQDSGSAWRPWTFFWTFRSSKMSVKLVNIFLWILENSKHLLKSQKLHNFCQACIYFYRTSTRVLECLETLDIFLKL